MNKGSMLKKISLLLLVVGFFGYGISKGIHIFTGQELKFSINKQSALYSISGIFPHAKEVIINGTGLETTEEGSFSYDFSPLDGLNIVTVTGKDSFGNIKQKTFSFIYSNNEAPQVALHKK